MFLLAFIIPILIAQRCACEDELKFSPTVTAVCRGNNEMVITVTTEGPFYGLLTSRNVRNNSKCFVEGDGEKVVQLTLNMAASINEQDYCAVSVNVKTGEKTVQIGVRQHKTLELAEDKLYVVSCGKYNSPAPVSALPVRLYFTDSSSREVKEVVKSHAYKLHVKSGSGGHFKIRNCFSFTQSDNQVPLFDHNGCPESKIVSRWNYFNDDEAEATIFSMFRFQESRELTFQCHILLCDDKESCVVPGCSEESVDFYSTIPQRLVSSNITTDLLASVTVNVLDVGDPLEPYTSVSSFDSCGPGSRFCPTWLLWLAIVLGVLFILMLLVNLFLCTALTCTCTRTEVIEKDPSIMEDYDPYRSSWAGSQRYAIEPTNKSKYSESNMSDHYATPGAFLTNSRPTSRTNKI